MKERILSRHAHFTSKLLLILALLFVAGFTAFSTHSPRPVASSETRFVERSAGGLQIVPASCPSNPDYPGQCSCPAGMTCTLEPQGNCIPSGGSVIYYGSGTVYCARPPTTPPTCPPGYSGVPPNCVAPVSPSGGASGGRGGGGGTAVTSCGIGYVLQGGQCVFTACPTGYTLQGAVCAYTGCPLGYTLQGTQCVFTACPSGYTNQGGVCIRSCTAQYLCGAGGNLYYQDATCHQTLSRACAYGCGSGACNLPPPPDIVTWKVTPSLVRSGDTAVVTWSAQNVQSCTVKGSNGDSWAGISGSKNSKPLVEQTIYTISCIALPGATPATVTRSTTVNIASTFNEI